VNQLDLVKVYLQADQPVMLWGAPGTGKTSALLALARGEGAHVETLIGSTCDPVDVGGYLIPSGGQVVCDPPPWAKRLRDARDAGRPAWLLLDELSCSAPAVQAALLRVAHERKVGALDLAGVRVVGASNPVETATAEGEIGPAMSNRWAHIDWTVDPTAWSAGTLTGWGSDTTAGYAKAAASVTSYLARDAAALCPADAPASSAHAWPSPRSWSAAIQSLAYLPDLRGAMARRIVAGCVGDSAAQAWSAYVAESDLPDAEDVLAGRAKLPKRGDQLAACLVSAAAVSLVEHPERATRVHKAWALLSGCRPDQVIRAAQALLLGADEVPDFAVELGNKIRAM
jgi:MoxR-like ATPase